VAELITSRVRALVTDALDRVFDEPFDVRSAQQLEDLVAAGPVGAGAPAATTLAAFVAAATPVARRVLTAAKKSGRVASKTPLPSSKALKVGLASIPVALRLTTTARRGVRELQLLASYAITRLRSAGVDPDPGLVRSLTLSLYLDPARRPALDVSGARAAGGVARLWVLRSLGGDAESAVRARARGQAEALDRLDLAGLGAEWRRHRPDQLRDAQTHHRSTRRSD
jgi:hypothetical protein